MKSVLLFLFLILSFLRAEIVFDDNLPPSKEVMMDYDSIQSDDNEVVNPEELKKNSEELLKDVDTYQKKDSLSNVVGSNNLFLNFINQPKQAFINQRVKIIIKATIARTDIKDLKLTFKNANDYKIFNPNSWKKKDENTYLKTFYIKFKTKTPKTPRFKVIVEFKKGFKNQTTITLPPIKIIKLASKQLFCGVIADNLDIISHSEKMYDDKSNIMLLEINATNSNLDDFHIPYSIKSGVDEFIDKGEYQKIFGFALISKNKQIFKFKYFNPKINHYELKSFNIVLKDQSVSTQTDLNPTKSKFALYKTIFIIFLALLFLLIFLKTKNLISLFIAIILLVFVAYLNIPMKQVLLKKGIGLKILPTYNSTIFYIVPKDVKANVAYEREGYYKVILPNQKIGWVKK